MRTDDAYLADMVTEARRVLDFASDLTYSEFAQDQMRCYAILKALEIVGEAASKISHETKSTYSHIPWPEIIGLRNRLVHFYFGIDPRLIWNVIQEDVPELIRSLDQIESPGGD